MACTWSGDALRWQSPVHPTKIEKLSSISGVSGFITSASGLDHREDIDTLHAFLVSRSVRIVHPPEYGSWAPGYYSVPFEDPEGIRLEVNFVPGKGHFEHPEQLPLKTMPGYEDNPI